MTKYEKKSLDSAIKLAKRIVPTRCAAPVLECVKLTGDTLHATDGMTHIVYTIPHVYDADESAPFIVNLARLIKTVGAFEYGPLIEISGDSVTSDGMAVTLETWIPADYPSIPPKFDAAIHASVDSDKLAAALESVGSAMSSEETRYYLKGIYLEHIDWQTLAFTATDGHRLVTESIGDSYTSATPSPTPVGHILPDSAVRLLQAALELDPTDGAISFSFEKVEYGRILITGSNFQITTRAIDNAYPDYRRVIPAKSGNVSKVDTASIVKGIAKLHKLHKGRVCIDTASKNLATESITVTIDIEPLCDNAALPGMSFNSEYIAPMVKAMCADTVYISAMSPGDPALFKPADTSRNLLGVVMPMRNQ